MFELTVHFKHEMIRIWQRAGPNFELTVFELAVPDLYRNETACGQRYVTDAKIDERTFGFSFIEACCRHQTYLSAMNI